MRHEGGHNKWRDGSGQLKPKAIAMFCNWEAISRSGAKTQRQLACWGHGGIWQQRQQNLSSRTGYRAKASVNGYSTGLMPPGMPMTSRVMARISTVGRVQLV